MAYACDVHDDRNVGNDEYDNNHYDEVWDAVLTNLNHFFYSNV